MEGSRAGGGGKEGMEGSRAGEGEGTWGGGGGGGGDRREGGEMERRGKSKAASLELTLHS